MEILIYALSASYAARSQKECVVPEPEVFQPFDLQALSNSADNMPSRFPPYTREKVQSLKQSFEY